MPDAILGPWILTMLIINASWFILSDVSKLTERVRTDFRIKDLRYIFVIPALIVYFVVFLISHLLPLSFWKRLANFKLYPRPEWSPILRRVGIILIYLLYLLFFTTVVRW
jgi:hypothetical protein